MKAKVSLKRFLVGVAAIALALAGWRMWAEWNDPILGWRRMLREGGPAERRDAALKLAQQGGRRAIPDLLNILEGPDETIRPTAVRAIARAFARRGLGMIPGSGPVPGEVIAALKVCAKDDRARAVRAASIESLAILAYADPGIRPFLRGRLDDMGEEGRLRLLVYDSLKDELQLPEAAFRYCSDPVPEIRRAAYRNLSGSMPEDDLVGLAVRGLADPDREVRHVAIRLIPAGFRGAAAIRGRALSGTLAALDDPYAFARWEACRALRRLTAGTAEAPRAMAALRARLASGSPEDQAAAAGALAEFGGDAVGSIPALIAAGAEDQAGVVVAAWLAAHLPWR